jgi:phosphoribosylamine-glycine ligase
MKILVIGSGGREHAICSAFRKSARVTRLYCANGNAGIATIADCVSVMPDDVPSLAEFASTNAIDLTFVGGETSLALGVVDEFQRRGLRIIGPTQEAAQLESSKAYAKDFMARHGIPTAKYVIAHSPDFALLELESGDFGRADRPVVVKADGLAFSGILFVGLMMTEDGPKVLEYNVRFGDPETQAILIRLESDLTDICEAMLNGTLNSTEIKWRTGSSACVVLATEGYPTKPRTGDPIEGLDTAAGVDIFYAGTARDATGRFITAGGRVLSVASVGDDLQGALSTAYAAAEKISWPGMQYRRDIGK